MSRLFRNFAMCALAALSVPFCLSRAAAVDSDCLAIAYTGENYGGDSWEIGDAGDYDLFDAFELPNDSVRSVRVRPGCRVVLFEHSEFAGDSIALEADVPLFGPKWRAQASSLKVEEAGGAADGEVEEWLAAIDADGGGGTLDALPKPENAYVVMHFDDLAYAAARLGHSFALRELLAGHMERDVILETLRRAPYVESISLVQQTNSSDYRGAIRLTGNGRKLLDFLPGGDRARCGEDDCEYMPLGRFLRVEVGKSGDEDNLYSVVLDFNLGNSSQYFRFDALVGDDGKTLFIGSGPEEAKQAKHVFESGEGRVDIARKSERKSFILVEDTGDEDGDFMFTESFLRGALGVRTEPSKGVSAEISWDLADNAFRLSFLHNIADMLLSGLELAQASIDTDDPGLGFGGGAPWLAGILGLELTGDNLLDLMVGFGGGDRDGAGGFLKQLGIDPDTAASAFRSIGFVLGGDYRYRWADVPGGYAFVSGDAEKMSHFKPLIERLVSHAASGVEAVDREGWDFFYVPEDGDWKHGEHPTLGEWGVPYFIGMRDGVILAGALAEDSLLSRPQIAWSGSGDGGESPVFRISVSPANAGATLAGMKGLQLMTLKFGLDQLGMGRDEAKDVIRALVHCQEIGHVTLDVTGHNSVELSIDTRDVDYRTAWELLRLSELLSGLGD